MLRSVRRKFILASMLSIVIVLELIIFTANIVNYARICERADHMTEWLSQGDGRIPGLSEPESGKGKKTMLSEPEPKKGGETELSVPEPDTGRKPHLFSRQEEFSPETPFETRFFSVTLDADGEISGCDIRNIAAVSETQAWAYAEEVYGQKRQTGFKGIYRFRKEQTSGGTRIIFLDCRRDREAVRSFAVISFGSSSLGLLAVYILVLFFSRLALRPAEESYKKQKQFITDASHEIKTPLSIIAANTEVLEMEYGETQWSKSIRNQIRRLTALTGQLTELAKLDEETGGRRRENFSLSDAVVESVSPFEALACTKGKTIEAKLEEQIGFRGDEQAIRQMVGILMDNAVKYSVPGAVIRVSLKKKNMRILLEVSNQARGLPQGKLDRLFERFYRLDASRNSSQGGTGIGLSVAKAIVQSHKGKITAESRDGENITVTVVL